MQMINTRLTNSTTLTAGSVIPLGEVVHRNGCTISAGANTIKVDGAGFYKITASATIEPTTAVPITVSLNNNGNVISSATATPSDAGAEVNLSIVAVVYNKCSCIDDLLTLTASVASTVTELDVVVERL